MITFISHAYIAMVVLSSFSDVGDVQLDGWVKLHLCETPEEHVDAVIDNLLDAGYVRATVEQRGESFIPALVLTEAGACSRAFMRTLDLPMTLPLSIVVANGS